jgi:uncharacterized protein YpuA (DUF1002 family)
MTRKFETEKHAKKRHKHFIGRDQIHAKERMASLKQEEPPAMNGKTESANKIVEPAKQSIEIKPAASTSAAEISSTQPVMVQRTFQFAKKKNALEKLTDKFRQLINHFK